MASWLDVVALILTAAVFGGAVYGAIYAYRSIMDSFESTKERLKDRGLEISNKGVSVKTSRRFDRDDYIDATQRGFVKTMGAASFGKADGSANTPVRSPGTSSPLLSSPSAMHRSSSSASATSIGSTVSSTEEKKKKRLWGKKKD